MLSENTVDRESQQKLYVQIYKILRGRIEKGQWPRNSQIPTEDELCRIYDVSKATVRIAVSELVREGYLVRRQGKGTFVTYSLPVSGMVMRTKIMEDKSGEEVKAKKEVVFMGIRRPSDDVRSSLKCEGEVYHIVLRRVANGGPVCLDESFIPIGVMPALEDEEISRISMCELIQEKAARRIAKIVQTVELTEITGEKAEMLRLGEGSPAVLVHRIFIGSDGVPLAYSRLYGEGRCYMFQTEFERLR